MAVAWCCSALLTWIEYDKHKDDRYQGWFVLAGIAIGIVIGILSKLNGGSLKIMLGLVLLTEGSLNVSALCHHYILRRCGSSGGCEKEQSGEEEQTGCSHFD